MLEFHTHIYLFLVGHLELTLVGIISATTLLLSCLVLSPKSTPAIMSKEMPPTVTAHTENVGVETAVLQSVGADTTAHAKQAARTEHELTAREAIRKYPRAIMWCLVVSMCVVMEGYDLNLLTNFYAYPAFAKRYGTFVESSNNYQLSAPWQAALGNASGIGAFFGTLLNGYLVTKFGHIRVLIGALFTLSAFIFIVFFAPSAGVMVAGQVLCGLPWGIFATTAPAYASEVLPMSLRVYLTSWTNVSPPSPSQSSHTAILRQLTPPSLP